MASSRHRRQRGTGGGETKVAGALQDYQDNTQKLKDRFTPDYSASAEVATVLKQSTAIDAFMQGAPSAMQGRSEWDSSRRTSSAWRNRTAPRSFPDGATPSRVNDKETAATAARSPQQRTASRTTSTRTRPFQSPTRTPPRKTSSC